MFFVIHYFKKLSFNYYDIYAVAQGYVYFYLIYINYVYFCNNSIMPVYYNKMLSKVQQ